MPGILLRGVPCRPNIHDILDCAWAARMSTMRKNNRRKSTDLGLDAPADMVAAGRKGWFANISQSVARSPWKEGTGTMLTSSMLYSFEMDYVLSGSDMMRLQGWPAITDLSHFSSNQLRKLSGEGFSLPCIAAILYPFYLCPTMPWWQEPAR
eukprot:9504103-Pyramimonas_sp.AAC.3